MEQRYKLGTACLDSVQRPSQEDCSHIGWSEEDVPAQWITINGSPVTSTWAGVIVPSWWWGSRVDVTRATVQVFSRPRRTDRALSPAVTV